MVRIRKGYTLLELVASVALLGLVMLATYNLFFTILRSKDTISEVMDHRDMMKIQMDKILSEESFEDVKIRLQGTGNTVVTKSFYQGDLDGLAENQRLEFRIGKNLNFDGSSPVYYETEEDAVEADYNIYISDGATHQFSVDEKNVYLSFPYHRNSHAWIVTNYDAYGHKNLAFVTRLPKGNLPEGNDIWEYIEEDKNPIFLNVFVEGNISNDNRRDLTFQNDSWYNEDQHAYFNTSYTDYSWYGNHLHINQNPKITKYQYRIEAYLYEQNRLLDKWVTYRFWR